MVKSRMVIEVSDRKGKYPSMIFEVEATAEFLTYGEATERYIKEIGYRARKPSERASTYYARFWNVRVG